MTLWGDEGSGSKGLQTISLGQGQGPLAEKLIMEAIEEGTWVITDSSKTKPTFRLWLTSYPSPVFPCLTSSYVKNHS
ncbi:hypothetical protein KUTeg_020413 [Tegillarca granosa]|uniref:Dynein heavy chain region D6 P-loop domain-containing protein n=1 Tax=Tegillarca granosa TaxID=220873 RepID=A0ABQ9EAK5_TEGGR|nr:hypothetical protein KUTeg_020413 [Tegillarca granosa]